MNANSEKRTNTRVVNDISASFLLIDKSINEVLPPNELLKMRESTIRDISSTGVRLKTKDLTEKWGPLLLSGEMRIGLKFQFSAITVPICVITRVMWVKKDSQMFYNLGLKYINISGIDVIRIKNYILEYRLKRK